MKKVFAAALAFVAFSAVQASAVTIDFTNSVWTPSFLADTVTVGNTTVESVPDNAGLGALSWSSGSGFGVTSFPLGLGPDINMFEALNVTFSQPFTLNTFLLGNLGIANVFGFPVPETAYYSLNGGTWQAVTGNGSGNVTVNVGSVAVTSLSFGYGSNVNLISEFSVKNLTGDFQTQPPAAVPEPTSMVLLGTGLVGLVARARRKKA